MINGMNSPAPRFISLDELLIIFICLCFYFIVYLSYRLIDKYLIKKSTIKLRLNDVVVASIRAGIAHLGATLPFQ